MYNIKIDYINHRINYLNNYIKELEKYKFEYDIEIQKERIKIYESIKQDLEVLKIFKNYISLSYIKNLISENKFSLNNFDWDIKDEKIIINRIKELKVLVKFLETNKVGDNNA